jgi:hypothetical protein
VRIEPPIYRPPDSYPTGWESKFYVNEILKIDREILKTNIVRAILLLKGTEWDILMITYTNSLEELTKLCSKFVKAFFAQIGLDLWDLKWEFAKEGNDLVVVDTIDTDSIRVTMKIENKYIHFNKQAIRDYYIKIHPDWIKEINSSKELAKKTGRPFQEYLEKKFPTAPEIDKNFIQIQRAKLETIYKFVTGQIDKIIAKENLKEIGKKELEYF